jgi:hypothetical protein
MKNKTAASDPKIVGGHVLLARDAERRLPVTRLAGEVSVGLFFHRSTAWVARDDHAGGVDEARMLTVLQRPELVTHDALLLHRHDSFSYGHNLSPLGQA